MIIYIFQHYGTNNITSFVLKSFPIRTPRIFSKKNTIIFFVFWQSLRLFSFHHVSHNRLIFYKNLHWIVAISNTLRPFLVNAWTFGCVNRIGSLEDIYSYFKIKYWSNSFFSFLSRFFNNTKYDPKMIRRFFLWICSKMTLPLIFDPGSNLWRSLNLKNRPNWLFSSCLQHKLW